MLPADGPYGGFCLRFFPLPESDGQAVSLRAPETSFTFSVPENPPADYLGYAGFEIWSYPPDSSGYWDRPTAARGAALWVIPAAYCQGAATTEASTAEAPTATAFQTEAATAIVASEAPPTPTPATPLLPEAFPSETPSRPAIPDSVAWASPTVSVIEQVLPAVGEAPGSTPPAPTPPRTWPRLVEALLIVVGVIVGLFLLREML